MTPTDRTSELVEKSLEEGGVRYQYFAMDFMVAYILEADDDGNVTKWDLANLETVKAATGYLLC